MSSVESKTNHQCLIPCKSCPWRPGSDASNIPGYNREKAVRLLRTASRGNGDALRPIMACHRSTEDEPRSCKGYLAREGWSNINVRLLLAKGLIENPSAVLKACETQGVPLEPDYPAVLAKLEKSSNA